MIGGSYASCRAPVPVAVLDTNSEADEGVAAAGTGEFAGFGGGSATGLLLDPDDAFTVWVGLSLVSSTEMGADVQSNGPMEALSMLAPRSVPSDR